MICMSMVEPMDYSQSIYLGLLGLVLLGHLNVMCFLHFHGQLSKLVDGKRGKMKASEWCEYSYCDCDCEGKLFI